MHKNRATVYRILQTHIPLMSSTLTNMTPAKVFLVLLSFPPDTVRNFTPSYMLISTISLNSCLPVKPSQQALHPAFASSQEFATPRGARQFYYNINHFLLNSYNGQFFKCTSYNTDIVYICHYLVL